VGVTTRSTSVAVVGAGVAGLAAARHLAHAESDVTVLEADGRIGGQVHTVEPVPGVHLELGAEALHLGAPGVPDLLATLGLDATRVGSVPLDGQLATARGLRPLPEGVGPAGPSRLGPVLRSRTLSGTAIVRAGMEPLVARAAAPLEGDKDVSVGHFVTRRFGHAVTATFVDPLLGGLHAGDVHRLSLRACAPMLVPAARERRSLVLRRRRRAPAMGFASWPGGLATLVAALAEGLDVRTDAPVTELHHRHDGRVELTTPQGQVVADMVVLAVPAARAARLLADTAHRASTILEATETADVATVLVAVDPAAAGRHLQGTGLLVPSAQGRLLKAATHLSHKWPHLADDEHFWIRLSAGRAGEHRVAALGDDALVAHLLRDLRDLTGLDAEPAAVVVRRWPAALPQQTVGHLDRVAAARADLPAGVLLAGAAYDGVGLAAALRSGTAAATSVLGTTHHADPHAPRPQEVP
jgi:oxygen-dependent protoporphyrinogen oxidase